MSMHIATFINETDLPIMVGSFMSVQNVEGLNKFKEELVESGKKITITSSTGEWFISNHFNEQIYKNMWVEKGLYKIYCSGKFRDQPCIRGEYSWMDTDLFNVIYEKNVFKFIYTPE